MLVLQIIEDLSRSPKYAKGSGFFTRLVWIRSGFVLQESISLLTESLFLLKDDMVVVCKGGRGMNWAATKKMMVRVSNCHTRHLLDPSTHRAFFA